MDTVTASSNQREELEQLDVRAWRNICHACSSEHLGIVGCVEHAALRLEGAARATQRVSERAANTTGTACVLCVASAMFCRVSGSFAFVLYCLLRTCVLMSG